MGNTQYGVRGAGAGVAVREACVAVGMVLTVQSRQLGDAQVSDRFVQLSFLIAAELLRRLS